MWYVVGKGRSMESVSSEGEIILCFSFFFLIFIFIPFALHVISVSVLFVFFFNNMFLVMPPNRY